MKSNNPRLISEAIHAALSIDVEKAKADARETLHNLSRYIANELKRQNSRFNAKAFLVDCGFPDSPADCPPAWKQPIYTQEARLGEALFLLCCRDADAAATVCTMLDKAGLSSGSQIIEHHLKDLGIGPQQLKMLP